MNIFYCVLILCIFSFIYVVYVLFLSIYVVSQLKMEYFWCENEANARKDTDFKEKLMNELKRPYCEEEHKRLLQEFTVQKPIQRHKALRHGVTKTYEISELGKSFHDHNLGK